jgi:hypothetical protein
MSLVVTFATIVGDRVTESRRISFGVAGIAMLFVVAGEFLLVSFLLRHWRSTRKLPASCRSGCSRDLWDDQLDG